MTCQNQGRQPAGMPSSPSEPHILLQDISEIGTYVCHWNGDLLRVTEHGIPQEKPPVLPQYSPDQPLRTTKVSDDPFVRISHARLAAMNYELDVSF